MKLKELADILGAELAGAGDTEITSVASIQGAVEGSITFITGNNLLQELLASRASAALAPLDIPPQPLPLLRVKNPRLAFARVLELFYAKPYRAAGISPQASVGKNVAIGTDPSIGPCVVICDNVRIGDRVTLSPGVYVGEGAAIGDDSILHPNVTIESKVLIGRRAVIHAGTVVGSDGFSFVTDNGRHHKIPQVGSVIIEDDVEIGSNSSIDRATIGNTVIKQGTKIDNQVQIAHNVTIGEHCLLAAQVGIAGSSTLGNYVVFGGRVGVADHTAVGDRSMAGGGTAITRDVPADQIIAGVNAMPLKDWLRVQAVLPRLPDLKKRIAELEKEIKALQNTEKQ